MDSIAFEHHLTSPQGHRRHPDGAFTATVGGFACCEHQMLLGPGDNRGIAVELVGANDAHAIRQAVLEACATKGLRV